MRPKIHVHVYRPRQVPLAKGTPVTKQKRRQFDLHFPLKCKPLALAAVAALGIGLGVTQFFHGKVAELQVKVGELQASNIAIVAENNRLLATSDQVISKQQVVAALAKKKVKLYEPDQGQVRRM